MLPLSTHPSVSEPSPALTSTTNEPGLGTLGSDIRSAEWSALAADAGSIFGTPEWLSIWWRHYGANHTPLTTACRRADGELAAILPVYLWMNRPARVVRFLGHGPGGRTGARSAVPRTGRPSSAPCWASSKSWGALLVGERSPSDEGWSSLLDARVLRREASPVLALEGRTWEAFFASRSKNFRSSIRSKEKRLADKYHVRYRLVADPESFGRDFELFLPLHRTRWPLGSSFIDDEPFQREFAETAFAKGWLRL